MLRARLFALAALETFARLAAVLGVNVVIQVGATVLEHALGIEAGKETGDGDVLRTAVDAIAASGAWNQTERVENRTHSINRLALGSGERLEIAHETDVVLHLAQVAHSR